MLLSPMYTFLTILVLAITTIIAATASPAAFRDIRGVFNYTLEFTSDNAYVGYQPNSFAGIAAAFHEYNTAPLAADALARSFFTVQLVNQSADSHLVLNTAVTYAIPEVKQRMRDRISNTSALDAYRAANPSSTMDDYLLSIGADPNDQQDMTARAAMAGIPLGFVGGGGLTSYAMIQATLDEEYLSFGALSTQTVYENNTLFVKLKGKADADFPVSMNIGFHRADLRCTSFLVMHLPLGDYLDVFTELLFSSNGFSFDKVSRTTDGIYSFVELAIALAKKPSCILFMDIPEIVEGYIEGMQSLTTHDMSQVNIVGTALNYKPTFNPPATFSNVVLTQISPHPSDTSSQFAVRAQAALTKYFADVPDELYGNASEANCSVVNTSVTTQLPVAVGGVCRINDYMKPSPFLEYQMMEGYMMGRLILDAVASTTGVVNMTTVRETVYRQRMFLFDDFDLGPYTNQCSAGGVFPCFCTAGVRSLFTSRVNGTTGRSYAITDRPELGEKDIARSTFPYDECQAGAEASRRSINIVYLDLDASAAAVEGSSTQHPGYDMFSTTLTKALSQFSLDDFHTSGSIYIVRRTLTLAEYQSPTAIASIVSELSSRYQPFAVATSFAVSESLSNASVSVAKAGVMEMRGVGLRETSVDHPAYVNEMTVDPSLAELIHGTASEAAQQGKSVLIIADTTAHGELAVLSLHTFGTKEAAVVVSADGTGGSADSHVSGGGIVLVASSTTATVQGVLEAVTGLNGSPTGSVYIAAPEACVYLGAVNAANTKSENVSVTVGFASGMRAWWSTTTSLGQRTSAIQYDDGMGGGSSAQMFTSNPIHAKAMYYAWVIYAAATRAISVASSVGGAPTFPNTLYNVGTLDVSGVQLGPYSNTTCTTAEQLASADRTCQCQNGVLEVYIHDLSSMIYGGPTTGSSVQRITGCSITYLPLPSAASDSTSLLIGVVAGVVGGMILLVAIVVVLYFCFFAGRNNRVAPKDESIPFTMAFTDIQASTTLWARAPSAMAPAVDLHHEVLRDVLSKHNGYEVKTIGDSFMIAFQHADDAVRFSADAQRTLYTATWAPGIDEVYRDMTTEKLEEHFRGGNADAPTSCDVFPDADSSPSNTSPGATPRRNSGELPELKALQVDQQLCDRFFAVAHNQLQKDPASYKESWCGVRVRIGVHTGMGSIKKDEVSGGYDYYGTVVNTAARVEGVGHGGQVLITDTTYGELQGTNVLEDCKCVALDLGEQPLRGLDAPVQLYQLNLSEFSGRAYLPLRLDIENVAAADDEISSMGSLDSVASNASEMSEQSRAESQVYTRIEDYYNPDLYARRVGLKKGSASESNGGSQVSNNISSILGESMRRQGITGFTFEDSYLLLTTTISTMLPAKAHEMIGSLAKTWRVRLSKEKGLLNMCKKKAVRNRSLKRGPYHNSLPPEVINKFHIVQLLEKVHPVMEVNRKKMRVKGGTSSHRTSVVGGYTVGSEQIGGSISPHVGPMSTSMESDGNRLMTSPSKVMAFNSSTEVDATAM